jgi:uncharacterized Zn-finger protein
MYRQHVESKSHIIERTFSMLKASGSMLNGTHLSRSTSCIQHVERHGNMLKATCCFQRANSINMTYHKCDLATIRQRFRNASA